MRTFILINFKNYKESYGKKSFLLAKQIAKVKSKKYQVAIAPSFLTAREIVQKIKIPVYAQHCDQFDLGAHTGSIAAAELKDLKLNGTILNHSEKKIPWKKLRMIVEQCHQEKLELVVCASTISEVKKIARLRPHYLAYEPKKLIGGNISVTKVKPDIIIKAVNIVKRISPQTKILCGAGIHSQEDIKQALLLGAKGVLIGHAVPKAKNPRKVLEKMLT